MRDFEPRVFFQTHDYGRSIKVQAFKKKEIISVCHEPFHPCIMQLLPVFHVASFTTEQFTHQNQSLRYSPFERIRWKWYNHASVFGFPLSTVFLSVVYCLLFWTDVNIFVFTSGWLLLSKKFQSLSFNDSQNLLVLNHQ